MKQQDTSYYGMGLSDSKPIPKNVRRAANVLRAVNHKFRQRILDVLAENDSMSVTDLYIRFRIEQSVMSMHLADLRRAGVVTTMRNGKNVYYSLDHDKMNQIKHVCKQLAQS